jgi:integrase
MGPKDDEHGPLLTTLVLTGMRSGEALALRWRDYDAAAARLAVKATLAKGWDGEWRRAEAKTERSRRTLPLPNAATRALRRQSAQQKRARLAAGSAWEDHGFIFTDAIGRPVRQWVVGAALTDSLKQLGLPHVRVHDLRHTAASLMLAQGVPLRTVSEHLGHAGLAITADLYVHLGEAQRREAAEALQRAVTGR